MATKIETIEKHTAKALEITKGQLFKIDQRFGPQLAVMVAFNPNDPSEFFSTGNTTVSLAYGPFKRNIEDFSVPFSIIKGDVLVSNRWNRMMTVVEDTFGGHDVTFDPCDRFLNCEILGQPNGHPGCRELHSDALKKWNIGYDDIPRGVNLFQSTTYSEKGIQVFPTQTKIGDQVAFRADADLIISVTSCPCPISSGQDIYMEVFN
jgi:hypothetical protein